MRVPNGYLKDSGQVFGDRGNSFNYGWSCDFSSKGTRDRGNAGSVWSSIIIPDRYETCGNSMWNINVPNAHYDVEIGYSDLEYSMKTGGCSVEGQLAGLGDLSAGQKKTKTLVVQVSDGKLTLTGDWPKCGSVSFVHISYSSHTAATCGNYGARNHICQRNKDNPIDPAVWDAPSEAQCKANCMSQGKVLTLTLNLTPTRTVPSS